MTSASEQTSASEAKDKTDNELIAEFMGVQVYKTREEMNAVPIDKLGLWSYLHQLAYDKEWNDLMPVVEKIESLMPHIKIPDDLEALKNGTHGSEPHVEVLSLSIASKISEVYAAVITFIRWYNANQPKS